MPRHYLLSPLNTVFFTQGKAAQPPDTEYIHFGKDLHQYRIRHYEGKEQYCQQLVNTDRVCFQFEQNSASAPQCKIYNDKGVAVYTLLTGSGYAMPGNLDDAGVQLYTFQWSFTFAQLSLPNGYYRLALTAGITPDPEVFISEVLDVQDEHANTLLIRYTHPVNEFDTIFSPLYPDLMFRVEGSINRLSLECEDLVFEDQDKEIVKLRSKPYRSFKLQIGVEQGVADWVLDKLNYILSCDSLRIADVLFVKEENAKWELAEMPGSPLSGASVSIREQALVTPYKFSNGPAPLMSIPSFPFFVADLKRTNGASISPLLYPAAIYDDDDLANWVAALNELGHYGEYVVGDDDVLYYENADGEYYALHSATVLTEYIVITASVTSLSEPLRLNFTGGRTGIDWGEPGKVNNYVTNAGSPTMYLTYMSYASTGAKTVYMFFSNQVTKFGAVNPAASAANKITAITGALPQQITKLELVHQDLTTLDASLVASTMLSELKIRDSHFEGFTSSIFYSNPFPQLKTIILRNNELSDSYVDSFFNNMYLGLNYNGGGLVEMQGQTPAAPPTGLSSTARAGLLAAAWTILTD